MRLNPNLAAFKPGSPVLQLIVSLVIVFVIGAPLFYLLILAGSFIFNSDPGVLGDPFIEIGLKEAGFIEIELVKDTGFNSSPVTKGVLLRAKKPEGH